MSDEATPPRSALITLSRAVLAVPISVLGLGMTALGLFALPVQDYSFPLQDTNFQQVRELAAFFGHRNLPKGGQLVSPLAEFWWRYGVMTAAVVLVLLVAGLAFGAAANQMGIGILGIAVLSAVLHAISLAQTADPLQFQQSFRAAGSLYDHTASGTWVTFAGLLVLAVGGLLAAFPSAARNEVAASESA